MEVAMILGVAVVAVTALLTFSSFFNKWYYEPVLKPGQPPLPPGSLGWPVFGNMAAFLRAFKSGRPDTFMAHYVAKYNRVGFYKAFLFWQPTVLAATPEACKFVLSKDSFETGWPESAVELMGRNSFAGLTGESHFKLRKLTEPAVNSPKALEQYVPLIVVDETLRLANISPMVFRRALVDVEFNGFTIPKGWHAEAWLRQVHMDPHVHPDPEKFDPERWEKYGASPFTFIPFGMGNRTCPGNELAKLQIFIVVHYFVTGYR
ncbi:hypothetical protein SELMODRAFT_419505 [Selaginella moellendorffii]|uniref:Uncharacterized protein n=1 Tax=Selaginella moellendorffii TaxID=88036 RepID=D8S960_SELML|nr:hypothetical protein SELMODRAFT_419505 [Selaginella moellendorffii]